MKLLIFIIKSLVTFKNTIKVHDVGTRYITLYITTYSHR